MNKNLLKFFAIFLFGFFASQQALAEISLSITANQNSKTKILFYGFDKLINPQIADPNSLEFQLEQDREKIFNQIKKNLNSTNLFEVIVNNSSKQHINQNPQLNISSTPDFAKFKNSEIELIIIADFQYDQSGNLDLKIRMWDLIDQKQIFGKSYNASEDNYRKVANLISDEIFKATTGEAVGHFNSQILYVSESGSIKKRIKKINLISFDGEDKKILTDGRDLVLTPSFSKKRDEILYLRYYDNKPQLFFLNLKNQRSYKVGGFRGTTFAASPHPNKSDIILISAIEEGNTDVYELNVNENIARKLTKSLAIDTTASYSPNGKSIIFSSDREGGQKIFLMDIDGTSIKRISLGSGSYSKPIWSPDGKLIAFTKIKDNKFYIGIMSSDGTNEKLLTSSYIVEGAKWSPNGRYLIYSKKKGAFGKDSIPRLYTIDIVTGFEYEIPTPEGEGATDPDWL